MHSNKLILCVMLFLITSCGGTKDDLFPSGADKRPPIQPGSTGPAVGQNAPDFTASDTLGNSVILSAITGSSQGVVLYFAMWGCPVCQTDMSYMLDSVMPQYPGVAFYAVDYLSGSVSAARSAQTSNGFGGFPVLADTSNTILTAYHGTMGKIVVIDKNGVIRMNEEFNTGANLLAVLAGLP